MEFIKSTIGLRAFRNGISCMVKVEASRLDDGRVILNAVSAHNLKKMAGSCVIDAEEWDGRQHDPYDDSEEAKWAMRKCGWIVTPCDMNSDGDSGLSLIC